MNQCELDTDILIIQRLKEIAESIEREPNTFSDSLRFGYYTMALELYWLNIIDYELYKEFMRVLYPMDWFYLIGYGPP